MTGSANANTLPVHHALHLSTEVALTTNIARISTNEAAEQLTRHPHTLHAPIARHTLARVRCGVDRADDIFMLSWRYTLVVTLFAGCSATRAAMAPTNSRNNSAKTEATVHGVGAPEVCTNYAADHSLNGVTKYVVTNSTELARTLRGRTPSWIYHGTRGVIVGCWFATTTTAGDVFCIRDISRGPGAYYTKSVVVSRGRGFGWFTADGQRHADARAESVTAPRCPQDT